MASEENVTTPVLVFSRLRSAKTPKQKKPKSQLVARKSRALTAAEKRAFLFSPEEPQATQGAILAVAYLLAWSSELPKESLSLQTALGLSHVLTQCAEDVGNLFTIDDVSDAGRDGGGKSA
jgi:hypothetical protein